MLEKIEKRKQFGIAIVRKWTYPRTQRMMQQIWALGCLCDTVEVLIFAMQVGHCIFTGFGPSAYGTGWRTTRISVLVGAWTAYVSDGTSAITDGAIPTCESIFHLFFIN